MMEGKTKVTLIILEILIAVGILAVPLFWAQKIARAASTGKAMLAHFDSATTDRNIPVYQIWNGSSWETEAETKTVGGDPCWCILRSCPKRNEKILGTLDDAVGGDVNVQVWNGSVWDNLKEVTTAAGTTAKRAFDITYEQSSGDGIVVFSVNNNEAHYSTWNGSAWGSGGNCVAVGTGDIEWIALASKPGADEIIMGTQDTNKDIYAQVWDGSIWGNAKKVNVACESTSNQSFDVAYEQSNKRALIVYQDVDDIPRYSIWDNGSWGTGGEATARTYGDQRWAKLASKPGSNQIVLGTMDDSTTPDIQAEIWYSGDTEGWSNMVEVVGGTATSVPTIDHRGFDVAYQNSSGKPMIVWSDSDNTAQYCIWDGVDTWSGGTTTAGTAASVVHWVALASNPDTDEIMLLACYAIDGAQFDDEYAVQKWDAGWGTISAVETAGYSKYESFAIDYDRHSPQVSIIIRKWRELYH